MNTALSDLKAALARFARETKDLRDEEYQHEKAYEAALDDQRRALEDPDSAAESKRAQAMVDNLAKHLENVRSRIADMADPHIASKKAGLVREVDPAARHVLRGAAVDIAQAVKDRDVGLRVRLAEVRNNYLRLLSLAGLEHRKALEALADATLAAKFLEPKHCEPMPGIDMPDLASLALPVEAVAGAFGPLNIQGDINYPGGIFNG